MRGAEGEFIHFLIVVCPLHQFMRGQRRGFSVKHDRAHGYAKREAARLRMKNNRSKPRLSSPAPPNQHIQQNSPTSSASSSSPTVSPSSSSSSTSAAPTRKRRVRTCPHPQPCELCEHCAAAHYSKTRTIKTKIARLHEQQTTPGRRKATAALKDLRSLERRRAQTQFVADKLLAELHEIRMKKLQLRNADKQELEDESSGEEQDRIPLSDRKRRRLVVQHVAHGQGSMPPVHQQLTVNQPPPQQPSPQPTSSSLSSLSSLSSCSILSSSYPREPLSIISASTRPPSPGYLPAVLFFSGFFWFGLLLFVIFFYHY